MNRIPNLILILIVTLILFGCKSQPESIKPTHAPEPFRIVGYLTSAAIVDLIPFEKLTHINYAFLIPKEDGTFHAIQNAWKLEEIVNQAHQNDVRVLISVGGWGYDAEFETIAADPILRATFVKNLTQFVEDFNLDGADIDWEYPDRETAQNFTALITELRENLPKEKSLTTAVVASGINGEGVATETFELFDFVNLMAYDGPNHSTLDLAQTSIQYWEERGLPPEKTVLGVPFYSHPNYIAYSKLVEADPEAAFSDEISYFSTNEIYNGIPTIQKKTELALEQASGIMIWTLEQDTRDENSLLNTIFETSKNHQP